LRAEGFLDSVRRVLIHVNSIAAPSARILPMNSSQEAHVPADFKLVAKIGLSVAAASCLGLVLVLFLVSDGAAASYGQIIGAYGLARKNLGPAMAVFGLAVAGFAGISAWLFSLYASFRIAGPLYRISRNLEQQIAHGPIAMIPIRASDGLQREWQQFDASVAALRAQRAELKQALREVEDALALNSAAAAADAISLEAAIANLKKMELRARL